MGWNCLGNSATADDVVEKLNDLQIGSSVTISLNAAGDSFVVWAAKTNPAGKTWKNLGRYGEQEEVADVMNQNHLGHNEAVVSVDANDTWQLWGFVQS